MAALSVIRKVAWMVDTMVDSMAQYSAVKWVGVLDIALADTLAEM